MHITYHIEDQSVVLDSSTGWLFIYREYFGRDILPDLLPALEAILHTIGNTVEVLEGDKVEDVIKALARDEVIDGLFIDLTGTELVTVLNIFWAMAKNEDSKIEPPEQYFKKFERFPFDEVLPKMFSQIINSSVSSKNLESLKARALLLRTISSSEDSTKD